MVPIRPHSIPRSKEFTMHLQKFICNFRSSLRIVALNGHLEAAMLFTQPRYNTMLPYLEEEIKKKVRASVKKGSMVLVSTLSPSHL